jgi:hypothetical protein
VVSLPVSAKPWGNLTYEFAEALVRGFLRRGKVNAFAGGFGVSTPFADAVTGDGLGFYILGPSGSQRFKIVDNALTVARFESEGATLDSNQRLASFNEVLATYGGQYDEDSGELAIDGVPQNELERKSLDFMALLLRLQDMYLLTQERTKSTFADDVGNRLRALNVADLTIESDTPVSDDLNEVIPDYVLRRTGRKPLALFLASTNEKILQAMLLQMAAEYEARKPISVIALLETGHSGTAKLRDRAANRLAAIPNWRGDEAAALHRILRELDVPNPQVH